MSLDTSNAGKVSRLIDWTMIICRFVLVSDTLCWAEKEGTAAVIATLDHLSHRLFVDS